MIEAVEQYGREFFRPLVQGWLKKVDESKHARRKFDAVADQCSAFFSGTQGFMWEDTFRSKYMGGITNPKFKITIAKAFELVALFGPTLYHKNPIRTFKPRKQLQLSPETFLPKGYRPPPQPQGDPQQNGQSPPPPDPAMEQATAIHENAVRTLQERAAADDIRNQLLSLWLNYTPDEMPDGGLAQHAETAITEGLVTGRGVLWPDRYKMPGSNTTLTGCFFDNQRNLGLDPDATSLHDAWWIYKEEIRPTWHFEREFDLPKGSLKKYATLEGKSSFAESSTGSFAQNDRAQGKTQDRIKVYKIWSKMGCGARLSGMDFPIKDLLEKTVGDYAYIVVSAGIPFPLNAPSSKMGENDAKAVGRMFRWPIPFHKDDRWPCAVLEFYRDPESAYPIAPMAPGLGELMYLNVFMSHLASRIWSSSRDFVAILESAAKDFKAAYESGNDLSIITISPGQAKNISELVTFLQQPQVNADVWQIVDRIMAQFDKRVGLTELLYGLNPGGTQARSATESESKRAAVSVRPDYMAGKVEAWMSVCADMEKMATRWFVERPDVNELLGEVGGYLWTKHITDTPVEIVVREMRATVEAGSARKPNKARDAENMNQLLPILGPMLDGHANVTGDTAPLNEFMRKLGETIDQDMSGLEMGPRVPQPPEVSPEEQQAQEQERQFEQAKMQMEIDKLQLENQGQALENQGKKAEAQGAGMEAAQKQQEGQIDMQSQMQKAEIDKQVSLQSIFAERDKFLQSMKMDQASHAQELGQDQQVHAQDMQQSIQDHSLRMDQAKADLEIKRRQARAQKKPATNVVEK